MAGSERQQKRDTKRDRGFQQERRPRSKRERKSRLGGEFIHQTNAPLFETFNTTEVWAAPDDNAFYGRRSILIHAEIYKPFILDEYDISPQKAKKNRAFYESLGGEGNPETFNVLRRKRYDGIVETNGDRCFLYPERVQIRNQDINDGIPNEIELYDG